MTNNIGKWKLALFNPPSRSPSPLTLKFLHTVNLRSPPIPPICAVLLQFEYKSLKLLWMITHLTYDQCNFPLSNVSKVHSKKQ